MNNLNVLIDRIAEIADKVDTINADTVSIIDSLYEITSDIQSGRYNPPATPPAGVPVKVDTIPTVKVKAILQAKVYVCVVLEGKKEIILCAEIDDDRHDLIGRTRNKVSKFYGSLKVVTLDYYTLLMLIEGGYMVLKSKTPTL